MATSVLPVPVPIKAMMFCSHAWANSSCWYALGTEGGGLNPWLNISQVDGEGSPSIGESFKTFSRRVAREVDYGGLCLRATVSGRIRSE